MRPIVKVLTPGAPDTGWGVVELEPGYYGLHNVPGSKANPVQVQDVSSVGLLLADPANPAWEPGSHELTTAQTRVNFAPQDINYTGSFVPNADTATPSIAPTGYDKWMLNEPHRIKARISVGTDQSGFTEPFDESRSLILELWFARTGDPAERPTVRVRFNDGYRLIYQSQKVAAGNAIVEKGFLFPYLSYAGTFAEFEAKYPLGAPVPVPVPEPDPDPVPVPTPDPEPQPDTSWIQDAIDDIEKIELQLASLKLELEGKL